ncbi:MAG TPA: hypothetical protein VNR11_18050 [Xanthobacteraceae bacterium]|nr:hypothetical protein [Xanthobacteraceae bacterium]
MNTPIESSKADGVDLTMQQRAGEVNPLMTTTTLLRACEKSPRVGTGAQV